MKALLTESPIHYKDFCESRHFFETDHVIIFKHYNKKKHTVQFVYYCTECYNELGDDAPAFLATVSVKDWKKIMRISFDTDN